MIVFSGTSSCRVMPAPRRPAGGEEYRLDVRTADQLARRIPLREPAAAEPAFRLEVVEDTMACGRVEDLSTVGSAV